MLFSMLAGMERRKHGVGSRGVWKREGPEDTAAQAVEARRPHVQQVKKSHTPQFLYTSCVCVCVFYTLVQPTINKGSLCQIKKKQRERETNKSSETEMMEKFRFFSLFLSLFLYYDMYKNIFKNNLCKTKIVG